jgi:hypothetical protein
MGRRGRADRPRRPGPAPRPRTAPPREGWEGTPTDSTGRVGRRRGDPAAPARDGPGDGPLRLAHRGEAGRDHPLDHRRHRPIGGCLGRLVRAPQDRPPRFDPRGPDRTQGPGGLGSLAAPEEARRADLQPATRRSETSQASWPAPAWSVLLAVRIRPGHRARLRSSQGPDLDAQPAQTRGGDTPAGAGGVVRRAFHL